MRRLVAHQFHEPLLRSAFGFEHHAPLQRTQAIVHKVEGNKDDRNPYWNEPFIAYLARRVKNQSLGRELVVQLLDQWLQRRALQPQTEFRNTAFEKFLVVK